MKKSFSYTQLISLLLIVFTLVGCNSGGDKGIPDNSKIVISPKEIKWTILNDECLLNDSTDLMDLYHDHYMQISLTNNNAPLGEVEIMALAWMSGNSYSGVPVVQLINDLNQNGVADPGEPIASNVDHGGLILHTDPHQGTAYLIVRTGLSCAYSSTLQVYAGHLNQSVNIEVVQSNDDQLL